MATEAKCDRCTYCVGDSSTRESYPIKDWESSYRVFALQNMLHWLEIPTSRDGVYGTETKENLKKFQRLYGDRYGLEVDGIPGTATMAALAKETIFKAP